ncbi:hypothetical protein MKW98_029448, partial [Papaver atlanticum]
LISKSLNSKMSEESNPQVSVSDLLTRVTELDNTVTGLHNDLTNLNNHVIATRAGLVVNATRTGNVKNRVDLLEENANLLEENANLLTARVTNVEGTAAITGNAVDNIVGGITTLGTSMNNAPGPTGTLLGRYKEVKKCLIKERGEIIEGYDKAVNRLDTLHFGSLTVIVILFAFNVWFYSHMPDAGEKMKPTEFWGRLGLVVLVTLVLLCFMWLLFRKLSNIQRQFTASTRRFKELSNTFMGLSQTPQQRLAAINAATAGEVRIQIEAAYEVAADYDDFQPESLIPSFEAGRFPISTLDNKPPTSSVYLWVTVIIVLVSAGLMIGLSVHDFVEGSPSTPGPSGPPM